MKTIAAARSPPRQWAFDCNEPIIVIVPTNDILPSDMSRSLKKSASDETKPVKTLVRRKNGNHYTNYLYMRVSDEMLAGLDKIAQRARESTSMSISRSDIVRRLIQVALQNEKVGL